MTKKVISITLAIFLLGSLTEANAQTKKERKSRYYQQSEPNQDFDVKGFFTEKEKNEVDQKPVEDQYDVKTTHRDEDGKYHGEKRVIQKEETIEEDGNNERPERKRVVKSKEGTGFYTTYGGYRPYNEQRDKYDKYYGDAPRPVPPVEPADPPPAPPAPPAPAPKVAKKLKVKKSTPKETEIKMTDNEHEYRTHVVKRRYTNLDVLCDDLDLAKIQRPVFKGICSECANDVDLIITNKNMGNLEKNYQLKTCYMMRDKRLREILDDDQYKKFLRIKDADEYLILTKDPEYKDGVFN